MDWLTILLAFVFFVLPLLQEALSKSKRGGPRPPQPWEPADPADPDDTLRPQERPVALPAPAGTSAPPGGGWSEEWGSWPSQAENAPMEEPEPHWARPTPVPDRGVEAAPSSFGGSFETLPSRVPESRQSIERSTPPERNRLEELADRLNQLARIESRPAPTAPPTTSAPVHSPSSSSSSVPARPARAFRAPLPLHSTAELRQAIILSEVLGPPLSMRGAEPNR